MLDLRLIILCDDPDGMHDTRDVPKDRQQDIQPEMTAYTDGEKHTDWGQKNSQNNS
jgi:hypothetical protein